MVLIVKSDSYQSGNLKKTKTKKPKQQKKQQLH